MATKYDRNQGRWQTYNDFVRESSSGLSGCTCKVWHVLFSAGRPCVENPTVSQVSIGIRALAKYSGCNVKTVQRALKNIENEGLVERLSTDVGKRSKYYIKGKKDG